MVLDMILFFRPFGYDETFGEMDPEFKHSISHRALAFKKLVNLCFPSLETLNKNNENLLSLYVHWPYCESKCPYCDFNSHINETIEKNDWINPSKINYTL